MKFEQDELNDTLIYIKENTNFKTGALPRCPFFTNDKADGDSYGCNKCSLYEPDEDEDFPPLCANLLIENHKGYCEYALLRKD